MKKAKLLCFLFLAAVLTFGVSGCSSGNAAEGSASPGVSQPSAKTYAAVSPSAAAEPDLSLNTSAVKFACDVVEALKARDYDALSQMIHPKKGVVFTPYSNVDLSANLKFTPEQIAALSSDTTEYVWGFYDGAGTPIELTMSEYFAKFVFNVDYTAAPIIGVNKVVQTGNSLENVLQVFPNAKFVEFHYPSLDTELQGMDWCSLKVVFEKYENTYKVVALVHSQWTI